MRKVLVATHASFAKGIIETLEFILGEQKNVEVMCAYLTQDFQIEKEIDKVLLSMSSQDELIVLVDLYGGSVSNAFSNRINDSRVHVIAGVNFPMLLDVVLNQDEDIQSVISRGIEAARNGIIDVNDRMKEEYVEEDF